MFPFEQLDSKSFHPGEDGLASAPRPPVLLGFAHQGLKPGFGFTVESSSGVELPRWPRPGFNPLPGRSHRTAPDIWDAL